MLPVALSLLALLVSLWVARKLARLACVLAFLGYAGHFALHHAPLIARALHHAL